MIGSSMCICLLLLGQNKQTGVWAYRNAAVLRTNIGSRIKFKWSVSGNLWLKFAKPSFRNKVFIALIEGSAKSFRLKSELEREFPAAVHYICFRLPSTEYK